MSAAPGSKFWLVMAILSLIFAIDQGLNALEATKTASVVYHVVLSSICLMGSSFYFLDWRRAGSHTRSEPD